MTAAPGDRPDPVPADDGVAADGRAAGGSPARSPPAQAAASPILDSAALFGGGSEVRIAHGAALYRLRRTALDKLILTK